MIDAWMFFFFFSGANGLASRRDFNDPMRFEESFHPGYTIIKKFGGELCGCLAWELCTI